MYLIIEDGHEKNVWQESPKEDEQILLHPRFIYECKKQNSMLRTDNALHLLPLPHRVPIVDFKQICIEFAMLGNQLDALVFENLANLFGFKKAWKE